MPMHLSISAEEAASDTDDDADCLLQPTGEQEDVALDSDLSSDDDETADILNLLGCLCVYSCNHLAEPRFFSSLLLCC